MINNLSFLIFLKKKELIKFEKLNKKFFRFLFK